jgi:hypothetical protein
MSVEGEPVPSREGSICFPGSQLLAEHFSPAPPELAHEMIASLISGSPLAKSQRVIDFFSSRIKQVQLASLGAVRSMASALAQGSPRDKATAVADAIAVAPLASVIENPFAPDPAFPTEIEDLFRWAGTRLADYGSDQAAQLARLLSELAVWVRQCGYRDVYVLESPLGGTVPSVALSKILESHGVSAERVTFLAPRLKASTEKHCIRRAAQLLAQTRLTRSIPIIFVDEVITGSRFEKLYSELIRVVPADRLVPIAMEVHDYSLSPKDSHEAQRVGIRNRLRRTIHAQNGAPVHRVFPPVPLIKVDAGKPFVLSAPFFWGEVDLAGGCRKVNFLFGLITEFKANCLALRNRSSNQMDAIKDMWKRAVDGSVYVDVDRHTEDILVHCAERFDWEKLEKEARRDFPHEYQGEPEPGLVSDRKKFTDSRMKWLLAAIERALEKEPEGYGGVFANALHHLFMYSVVLGREAAPRDRDFCEYTLPYSRPVKCFHEAIVEAIVERTSSASLPS